MVVVSDCLFLSFRLNLLGVIIFGSIRFLSKKVTKLKNFFLKKKPKPNRNRVIPTGFGLVWFFRAKTGSNRFGSVFPILARFSRFWLGFFRFWLGFFWFGLVFSVWLGFFGLAKFWLGFSGLARFWLGLARFFFRFLSVSVRFGFSVF